MADTSSTDSSADEFDPAFDLPADPFEFGAETLNVFRSILAVPESDFERRILPELRTIAAEYRRSVFQTLSTPKRALTNKELKKLAGDAKAFAKRLRSLDDVVLFEVMNRFEPEPEGHKDASHPPSRRNLLASELDDLARALRRAHKERRAQAGPERNRDLGLAVGLLVELYEDTTATPATHVAAKGGAYDGTPRSAAGRLVLAFMRAVDPRKAGEGRLKDSTISTAFPGTKHDDQVDALAQLLSWVGSRNIEPLPYGGMLVEG